MEFAASAILLFTFVFGIIDCSRAVYVYHFLANASEEATRYAMVRGASWTSNCGSVTASNCNATNSNIGAYVQSVAPFGVVTANLHVTATWPATTASGSNCLSSQSTPANSVGCLVSVTITYPFSFASPLLPHTGLTLTSTSQVAIAQ